ncbi:MAG: fasciclin domain-containing protein [Sedimentitalea sp.]
MPTIAEIASGPDFSILLNTVTFIDSEIPAAGLATALSSPGSLTVFAPNNAAFGALAADLGFTGDTTDETAVTNFLVANVPVATLRAVVEYHVLATEELAADIAASTTLTTLQGGTITTDLPTLVDNEPDLIDASLVATDIDATNGVVHVIDRVMIPVDLPGNDAPTITGIAVASGSTFDGNGADFDLLRTAVVTAGLAATLDDVTQDLTVFAPNDDAFVSLAQALGFTGSGEAGAFAFMVDALTLLSKGESPIDLLTTILTFHVSGESLQASQVLSGDPIPTLAGADLTVSGTSLVDAEPDLPNANLIATDIQAANGVVHVLDGVLIPADLLQSDGSNDVDFIIDSNASASGIRTGLDDDFISGRNGNDIINAGAGDDVVLGGKGRDTLEGRAGNDTIKGDQGRDQILGGKGNDDLDGGAGGDTIQAGLGDDTIAGGAGNDMLFGHKGDDVFVFNANEGNDIVQDFRSGQDLIDLTSFDFTDISDLTLNGNADRAVIRLEGTTIVLDDITRGELSNDDFIF